MGCLNDNGQFKHWFGNIHLSGPCNRKCYFCIGQHMMALDKYNILDKWPLDGFDEYIKTCREYGVETIYLTGTNTDPLLYKHLDKMNEYMYQNHFTFGVRTNAVYDLSLLRYFDKGSVTICSLDPIIYKKMMGMGEPPSIYKILDATRNWFDFKVNIVLGLENIGDDLIRTILRLGLAGVRKINLREPYGQPHIGDPLKRNYTADFTTLGMPVYKFYDCEVTYWDVHYVEVESVNLYASGRTSLTYPITKGCADDGIVLDQTHFHGGRVREQWV